MDKLRLLDFDDLYLLRLLLNGASVTGSARQLGLTQPAITQRLRKIERVFACPIVQKSGRSVTLTREARAVCERASAALSLIASDDAWERSRVINVATRPETGARWLGPTLISLKKELPDTMFHCFLGSGEEILRMLGTGKLDAVLTSAPHTTKEFSAVDVCEEEYVFVAVPRIAKTIVKAENLQEHLLIEYDRSFPFQRYLKAETRARLRFKDVWFLGSTLLMTEALLEGLGVGVVPLYLVRDAVERGKLLKLFDGEGAFKLSADAFRLVFRNDRDIDEEIKILADALREADM